MCTAITLRTKDNLHLFGRNLDIEREFGQSIILVPRNFPLRNNLNNIYKKTRYAILGMGTIFDNYPLFADGLNEKGLACAALLFPNYAFYTDEPLKDKVNITTYNFILYILGNFESLIECRDYLKDVNLINSPIDKSLAVANLHWMITDKTGDSIVVEQTKEGINVYDNTVGVLTNSPEFPFHKTNLNQYMGMTPYQPDDVTWVDQPLRPLSQGLGSLGIPGDLTSPSRFIKATYLKNYISLTDSNTSEIDAFFHILDSVSMPSGAVITPEDVPDFTLYTSCMCQEKGIYYYTTYNNRQINAINMFNENLDSKRVKVFKFNNIQSINQIN